MGLGGGASQQEPAAELYGTMACCGGHGALSSRQLCVAWQELVPELTIGCQYSEPASGSWCIQGGSASRQLHWPQTP